MAARGITNSQRYVLLQMDTHVRCASLTSRGALRWISLPKTLVHGLVLRVVGKSDAPSSSYPRILLSSCPRILSRVLALRMRRLVQRRLVRCTTWGRSAHITTTRP